MKGIRRMIGGWLVLFLVFSMLPIQAFAVGETVTESAAVTEGERELMTETDAPAAAVSDEITYYTTPSEVAAVLREAMKNRQETVVIGYQTDAENGDIRQEVFEIACSHTGNPTEGDYLVWHFDGGTTSMSFYEENGIQYITITYSLEYKTTADQERQADAAAEQLLAELALDNMTDYEKVMRIYSWICANVSYDYAGVEDDEDVLKFTAYGALIDRNCVCQGYATLFYRLALSAGVDCRVISGVGNGEDHSWNIVCIDGKYYNVDATWDATQLQNGYNFVYFLKCENNFADHTRDEEYAADGFNSDYPMADVDYDCGEIVPIDEEHFPDDNFREYILSTVDADQNGILSATEAQNAQEINVGQMDISSIKGIEYFRWLKYLYCHENKLSEIDVSDNLLLTGLYCWRNQLTQLDVSSNSNLRWLYVNQNSLTGIDVSGNSNLEVINCSFNMLSELVVSKNTKLYALYCEGNQLRDIDVSMLGGLQFFDCQDNLLTSLDVSNNPELIQLICQVNQLEHLDVSNNVKLTSLWCSKIGAGTLDLSNNVLLEELFCADNNLAGLDLSNNPHMTDLRGSGNIIPIKVTDGSFSLSELQGFDPDRASDWQGAVYDPATNMLTGMDSIFVSYKYDCGNGLYMLVMLQTVEDGVPLNSTYFPDDRFRQYVYEEYDINQDEFMSLEELNAVENVYVPDMGITSLEGIEYFGRLTNLRCGGNSISEIKISGHSLLNLFCNHNQITALDLGDQPDFSYLELSNNPIEELDVSQYALDVIYCKDCTNLTALTLPESITQIYRTAFAGCSSLTNIVIPKSVAVMEDYVFERCTALKTIKFTGSAPDISDNAFYGVTATCFYPAEDDTWVEDLMQNYGGDLTWKPLGDHPEHQYEAITTAPTCTEQGYTRHTCVCGDTYYDNYVEALGHTEATVAGKAATCTETGLTEGRQCSVCGTVTVKQEAIPAKGHTVVKDKAVAATCSKDGKTEGSHCTVCYTVIVAQTAIPATKEHTYSNDQDATCNVCGDTRQVKIETTPMYRLYNPYTLEHLFTSGEEERDMLASVGWIYEGIAWYAPASGDPVYRLYNPYDDGHFYTMSKAEVDSLTPLGWQLDGVVCNTAPDTAAPIYRLFNPYELKNYHHYTASEEERDWLASLGWIFEGVAWYGMME